MFLEFKCEKCGAWIEADLNEAFEFIEEDIDSNFSIPCRECDDDNYFFISIGRCVNDDD